MEYTLLLVILVFFLAGPCLSLPAQVIAYESLYVLFILIKTTYFNTFILQISSQSNFGARRQRRSYAGILYCIVWSFFVVNQLHYF